MNTLADIAVLDRRWGAVVAVAIVIAIGVIAMTPTLARLRRHRAVALVSSAGGVAIPIGVALGPFGLGIVTDDVLADARPLVMIGLGWIGMIVGLQLRRDIIARVPRILWRWTIADALGCGAIAAAIGGLSTLFVDDTLSRTPGTMWLAIVLTGLVAIGWSPETRSLGLRLGAGAARVRVLVQAGSGLASLITVAVLGVVAAMVSGSAHAPVDAASDALVAVAAAIGVAFGARFLLAKVQRNAPEATLVLLGGLAFLSGAADELGVPALFVGLLCGATLANLGGAGLRDLEENVRRAEPALATFFFVIAGTLIRPGHLVLTFAIAAALLAVRVLVKPAIASSTLGPDAPSLEREFPVRSLPLRQAPIVVPMLVGAVVATPHPALRSLLAAAVATGLVAAILTFAAAVRPRRADALGGVPA
ncbi:MAG: hypothetical protein U0572_07835 [Phycisphaerales bacterium]